MSTDTVTIMYDVYRNLVRADTILGFLIAAGVDNWEGYDEIDWDAVDEEIGQVLNTGV